MLNGAYQLPLITGFTAHGLGFIGSSSVHSKKLIPKLGLSTSAGNFRAKTPVPKLSVSTSRPISQPRFIQHKKEAFWFYGFLSIVYDHVTNLGPWTEDMRDEALEPADLSDRNMIGCGSAGRYAA
ncbi:hypothetical protein Ancab_020160 [Ancistrocladus abbreviatus]